MGRCRVAGSQRLQTQESEHSSAFVGTGDALTVNAVPLVQLGPLELLLVRHHGQSVFNDLVRGLQLRDCVFDLTRDVLHG